MYRKHSSRLTALAGATALLLSADFAAAQGNGQKKQQQRAEKQAEREQRAQENDAAKSEKQAQKQAERAERVQAHEQGQQQRQAERQQRAAEQQQQAKQQQQQEAQQQARAQRQVMREERIQAQQAGQRELHAQRIAAQKAAAVQEQQQMRRVSTRMDAREQQRIARAERERIATYAQALAYRQTLASQRATALQQQRRLAQYQYQQQYLSNLRRQQQLARSYSGYNDQYVYEQPSHRYSRGGQYYEVNRYGADLLREAVDNGYAEGVRAGQADRQDNWRFDYQNAYAYQDANAGYTGYYVNQSEYNHYFREGFQRGYEDGYYSRQQYGRSSGGKLSLLANIVSTILQLQSLR